MNTIKDVIIESFEQGASNDIITFPAIFVTTIVSLICALAIYLVYKKFYRGAVYSENFNLLNVMLCIITAFIITTIRSNIVLSLGMVGALSIVRFRSAVKDPLDIGFLFWSIAAGITTGAGLYPVAILTTIFLSAIYIVFSVTVSGKKSFLLVIKYFDIADDNVKQELLNIPNTLKSKTQFKGKTELTLQVKIKNNNTDFVKKLSDTSGVDSAMLIEYTGDYI